MIMSSLKVDLDYIWRLITSLQHISYNWNVTKLQKGQDFTPEILIYGQVVAELRA